MVDGVTLAFAGRTLLERTEFRLVAGRRYARCWPQRRWEIDPLATHRRRRATRLAPPARGVCGAGDAGPIHRRPARRRHGRVGGQRRRGALEAERDELEAALLGDDADLRVGRRAALRGGRGVERVRGRSHESRGQRC